MVHDYSKKIWYLTKHVYMIQKKEWPLLSKHRIELACELENNNKKKKETKNNKKKNLNDFTSLNKIFFYKVAQHNNIYSPYNRMSTHCK